MNNIYAFSTKSFLGRLCCTSNWYFSHSTTFLSDIYPQVNHFPIFCISTKFSFHSFLLFLSYRTILIMCSEIPEKSPLHVAYNHHSSDGKQKSGSFSYIPFSHLFNPTVNTATPTSISLSCMDSDAFLKMKLLNVCFTVLFCLVQVTDGTIHVQEDSKFFHDFNFDAKFFSSQFSFIQERHKIASSMICSNCRNNYFRK